MNSRFYLKFLVILGLDPRISIRNSRFICDEIHGSSGDDTRLRNSRLFVMRSKKNGCEAKNADRAREF